MVVVRNNYMQKLNENNLEVQRNMDKIEKLKKLEMSLI